MVQPTPIKSNPVINAGYTNYVQRQPDNPYQNPAMTKYGSLFNFQQPKTSSPAAQVPLKNDDTNIPANTTNTLSRGLNLLSFFLNKTSPAPELPASVLNIQVPVNGDYQTRLDLLTDIENNLEEEYQRAIGEADKPMNSISGREEEINNSRKDLEVIEFNLASKEKEVTLADTQAKTAKSELTQASQQRESSETKLQSCTAEHEKAQTATGLAQIDVNTAETNVSTLEAQLSSAPDEQKPVIQARLTAAKQKLAEAVAKLEQAKANEQRAKEALDQAQKQLESAKEKESAAKTKSEEADRQLETAKSEQSKLKEAQQLAKSCIDSAKCQEAEGQNHEERYGAQVDAIYSKLLDVRNEKTRIMNELENEIESLNAKQQSGTITKEELQKLSEFIKVMQLGS
jgi:chromosome segregation ATPase